MAFPAFHLPGVALGELVDFGDGTGDRQARLRIPSVTPTLLEQAVAAITTARDGYLAELPARRIIEVIDAAIGRWLEPDYPLRRRAEELPARLEVRLPGARRALRPVEGPSDLGRP